MNVTPAFRDATPPPHLPRRTARPGRLLLALAAAICALAAILALTAASGCRHTTPPPTGPGRAPPPATAPLESQAVSTAPVYDTHLVFESAEHGFRVRCPPAWTPRPSADYVLLLTPADAERGSASLSVDVPALPPHIPGWIPLNLVVNGYVDDLKKSHPGLRVEHSAPHKFPGAKAHRVRSTWRDESTGTDRVEDALLMVRGDAVYILRADADAPAYKAIAGEFDAFTRSLVWLK